ncbi:MAG: hypothetical protein N2381_10890, partial [Armatimonadetes bacterium]|nr:hypothetical protein [Armatimonadota bacterium]
GQGAMDNLGRHYANASWLTTNLNNEVFGSAVASPYGFSVTIFLISGASLLACRIFRFDFSAGQ